MGHLQKAGVTLACLPAALQGKHGFLMTRPNGLLCVFRLADTDPSCMRSGTFYPKASLEFGHGEAKQSKPEHSEPNRALRYSRGAAAEGPARLPCPRSPLQDARNCVTFILLGYVRSQVRLLQIEYRNIHSSFQKGS